MAESVGTGVREKLRRANIHRQTFEDEVERFLDFGAYTVSRHDDIQAGERRWKVKINEPVPQAEWGALIGDSLFNFRSALDHLAFDLAVAYTGRLTAKQEGDSEFPIFYRRAPTKRELDRKIGAVHPEARKVIEAMQPYGRGDRAILEYLDTLHNFDKHRTLHLVAGASTGLAHFGDMTFTRINFLPFEDGDVLAAVPLNTEGDQDPHFSFGVAFSDPSIPDAAGILRWIDTHIQARVIPDLLPYL